MSAFASMCLAEFAFRGWFPPGLALLLAVVGTVLVVHLYWREAGRMPRAALAVMAVAPLPGAGGGGLAASASFDCPGADGKHAARCGITA